MKIEKYMEAIERIETPQGLEQDIYTSCVTDKGKVKSRRQKNNKWKIAVCTCMAALVLAVGIPVLTTNPQTGQGEVEWTGLTVKVKAGEVEQNVNLIDGAKKLSESGVELDYQTIEKDGEVKEVFGGYNGLSFQINAEGSEQITYESESQRIHCEFMNQNHPNGSEEYVWSGISIGMETEEFAAFVADIENPQKEELAALLDDMLQKNLADPNHELNQMDNFVGMIKTTDIDFMSLNLSGAVAYKGESSAAFVRIENPDNSFQPPVEAPTVTTTPGEPIDWMFSRETLDYLSATPKNEVDFSKLNDNVTVTATMKDGTVQVVNIKITFDENGQCTTEFIAG